MKLDCKTAALIAGLLLVTRSSTLGAVFDEKSPAQKLRADVATQLARYKKCLANVVLACEKKGFLPGAECHLATATANPPADPKGTFAAQVAKCDAKLDFGHKGPKGNSPVQNYELIGCPSYGAGTRFADMDAYEDAASFLKAQVDSFVSSTPTASGCTDTKSCRADMKILLDFASGLTRCQTACENDYKDKKGDGGPTDDVAQCGLNGDLAAQICAAKVVDKFFDQAATWPLRDLAAISVLGLVDDLSDDLFNVPLDCN